MVGHILFVEFHKEFHAVLHLVDMGEAQLFEAGVDLLGLVFFLELADEDGRDQRHAAAVVLNQVEVVLLDIDGLVRATLEAFAAVYALVVGDDGLAAADADGRRRADAHAGRAAGAQVVVDLQGVTEIGIGVSHNF